MLSARRWYPTCPMLPRPWYVVFALAPLLPACAGQQSSTVPQGRAMFEAAPAPVLAGGRCSGGTCTCRGARDLAENPPPPPGKKRIEIRMSAAFGKVSLDSPTVGHFTGAGREESCYYVDVQVSQIYDFHLDSREDSMGGGVGPEVVLREYGPAGPYWYDIVKIKCGIGDRTCDLDLARAFGSDWLDQRKRGRLDPCGSMVVKGLRWNTSGGQSSQNGGALRDFFADFALEVKKFQTEFRPGDSHCTVGLP